MHAHYRRTGERHQESQDAVGRGHPRKAAVRKLIATHHRQNITWPSSAQFDGEHQHLQQQTVTTWGKGPTATD